MTIGSAIAERASSATERALAVRRVTYRPLCCLVALALAGLTATTGAASAHDHKRPGCGSVSGAPARLGNSPSLVTQPGAFGAAGPPPLGAAGPPPLGAAGPPPLGAAGPPAIGAAGAPRLGVAPAFLDDRGAMAFPLDVPGAASDRVCCFDGRGAAMDGEPDWPSNADESAAGD